MLPKKKEYIKELSSVVKYKFKVKALPFEMGYLEFLDSQQLCSAALMHPSV